MQKLLYGLEGAWVNAAGKRKLDGFHARCLRRILKISPAYISRVSNSFVLQQLSAIPLSSTLLERQLLYFGHVARSDNNSSLRKALFHGHGLELRQAVLKQGRPRDTWGKKIFHEVLHMCGDLQQMAYLLSVANFASQKAAQSRWKDIARQYCRQAVAH